MANEFVARNGVIAQNNSVVSGSLVVTNGITGSLFGTSSQAVSASYSLNGGVTQILAGTNVTIAPTNGKGQVTISATGGGGSNFNTATGSYGSFYDTTTQTNPVANTPRSMSFNTTDITNGVSISGSTSPFNTYIKTENAGVYDIQFSAQLDKTDSGIDEIVIWLAKNGTNLSDTATTISLNGNNDKQVAAWNWFVNSAANDYYQIIWYSADTDLRILAEAAGGGHPGIPSVIATVNRVDQFLSNSGSFSGSFSGNFSGSLVGTSSQAVSASYAFTVNYLGSGSISTRLTNLETASGSLSTRVTNTETTASNLVAASASFSTRITSDSSSFSSRVSSIEATTASLQVASGSFSTRVTQIERTYATTGSNTFSGSQNILGAITASAALINGTLTAQTLVVSTVSSSVVFSSGSNIFGNSTANTQTMTGSLNVSGSATIIGRVTATDLTGSLFGTASQALTASYALNAANAFIQNGNSFGAQAVLGTNDLQNLALETNNSTRLFISSSGAYVGIGTVTPINSGPPQALLDVNGLIRAGNGIQIIGNSVTTVLSSSRSDNTQGGALLFNGWGDYAFNTSLLVGYNSTTLGPVGLGAGNLFVSNKIAIGKTGSSAAFDVNGNAIITGSLIVLSGITGSLFGTASQALTASYLLGGGSGVGFPFTGSAQITGSLGVTGSLNVTLGITASLFGTASQAVTASYALYAAGGSASSILFQTASAATTWSFNHFLQTQYPVFTIYDNTNSVIIPQRIHAVDTSSALIYFSTATTGVAVASKGGYSSSVVISATTANTAISASFASSGTGTFSGSFSGSHEGTFSGSYFGTASQATSASYAYTASSAVNSSASLIAVSASYALNATNAVNATNSLSASSVLPLSQSVIITGSLLVTGSIRTDANVRGATVTFGTELGSNGGEIRVGQTSVRFGNNIPIQWSQTTDSNATKDLGLRRNNTGSLEIYNGVTADGAVANRRDLILRNITGSNAFFSSSLEVSGSASVTGSLNVSQGITGSLFGTASQALTASFLLGGVSSQVFPYSGSAQITGSLGVTGSINSTGNITTTGTLTAQTLVVQTITSSITYSSGSNIFGNALTNTQTMTGSVNITGSLTLRGNQTVFGVVTVQSASFDYGQNTNVVTGSFQVITSVATGSYRCAFFDYVMFSGSIVRAGTVASTWSGSATEYYENYTADLGGSTSGVTLQTAISTGNIQLQATASTAAWTIRSLIRLL
jgi:hypothetical protein